MARKNAQLAQSETVEELPLACSSESEAVAFFERKRWHDCPCCVRCGSVSVYAMKGADGARNKRYLWRCRDCKGQFTVRTGTVFEESLIPMRKWALALWECASCKNGCSALELSRKVQVSYKTALFMMHRLRFAMADDQPTPPKFDGVVEADETYVGGKVRHPNNTTGAVPPDRRGSRFKNKTAVMGIVQRGGNVRARIVPSVDAKTLSRELLKYVEPNAHLMTDAATQYILVGRPFRDHDKVRHHMGEYWKPGNGKPDAHTNTIEAFWARLKRSMHTYQAVSKKHLHRYVAHTAFLHNTRMMNDGERTVQLIAQANGKRFTYADQVGAA